MTLTPGRRAAFAVTGTATLVSSIAGTAVPAHAFVTADTTPTAALTADGTPRANLSALVDSRPEVIAARKSMLAARVVAARTKTSLTKAYKAYKARHTAANRKALARAKAAHARALRNLAKAHESYINAEVQAIDLLRRNGRPVLKPTPEADPTTDTTVDEDEVLLPTPEVWGEAGDSVASIGFHVPPDSGVTAFRISRNGGAIAVMEGYATQFADAELVNDEPYTYSVVALDNDGHRSLPGSVTLMPGDFIPPDPTTIVATAGDGAVTLGFEAISDAAAYRVYQDGALVGTAAASDTSYVAAGLTNGTTYSFVMTVVDASGNESIASNGVTGTPSDQTPPDAPVLAAAPNNASADLSWTAVADATSYNVYRDGANVASPSGTSYTDTGLANGTTYEYFLTAVDAAGNESAPSAAETVTPTAAGDTTPPDAPTSLAVSTAANGSVSLSWAGPADAAAYDVYQDISGTASLVASTNLTSYTVSGLTNGASYTFFVKARDAAANASAPSSSVTATPVDTIAPGAPTASATAGDAEVLVAWTGDADTSEWVLYQDDVEVGTFAASTHSTTITSLTNDTTYAFTVVAKDATGNASSPSSAATATPTSSAPPPPPPDTTPPLTPTLTLVSAANGQASVSWSGDAADTAAWLLYRNGSLLATLGSGTTAYDATGLTNGSSYTFSVYARDSVGNVSVASNTITATPLDTVAPNAPTNLSGVAGNGTAALSWNGPVDAVKYRVYQDGVALTPDVTSGSTLTVSGLSNGTTYSFAVTAFDAAGNESAASGATSVVPVAPVVVLPAATLTAGAAYNQWADLSWTSVTGASSYRVYKNGIAIAPDVNGTSTRVTGLTNGTTYSFTVKAVDGSGILGSVSNTVTASPVADTSAPSKPVITGGIRGNGSVTLSWTESSADATNYDVYYGTSSGAVTTLAGNTTNKSYAVTGLTNGTTYYFAVKAKDAAGNTSTASATWTEGPANNVNGTFTGTTVANGEGVNITVTITVSASQITAVSVPDTWTGKRTSDGINAGAIPVYINETLTAQTTSIALVSGATKTHTAFKSSLQAALNLAGLK